MRASAMVIRYLILLQPSLCTAPKQAAFSHSSH
jgi:hypothetical protein